MNWPTSCLTPALDLHLKRLKGISPGVVISAPARLKFEIHWAHFNIQQSVLIEE